MTTYVRTYSTTVAAGAQLDVYATTEGGPHGAWTRNSLTGLPPNLNIEIAADPNAPNSQTVFRIIGTVSSSCTPGAYSYSASFSRSTLFGQDVVELSGTITVTEPTPEYHSLTLVAGTGGSIRYSANPVTRVSSSSFSCGNYEIMVNGTDVVAYAVANSGYSFKEWQENGTKITSGTFATDHTLTAVFQKSSTNLNVSFSPSPSGSGTCSPSSVAVPSGTQFTTSGNKLTINGTTVTAVNQTRGGANTGYTFSYWNPSSGTISANTTVYAVFVKATYTITFDKQGGSGGTSSQNVLYGSTPSSITAPTRSGYVFKGYWTGANQIGTQYFNASGAATRAWDIANSYTLYAGWDLDGHTCYFLSENTTKGTVSRSEASAPSTYCYYVGAQSRHLLFYDSSLERPTTAIEVAATANTGYTFDSWYIGSTNLDDGNTHKVSELTGSSTTFTAKFTTNVFHVQYHAGGGATVGDMPIQDVAYNSGATAQACGYTYPGYVFDCWKRDNTGSRISVGDDISTITSTNGETIHLYAQWVPENSYVLNFQPRDAAYGSVSPARVLVPVPEEGEPTVKLGVSGNVISITLDDETVTVTASPTDGCAFASWSYNDQTLADQTPITGDMEIFAEFTGTPSSTTLNLVAGQYYPLSTIMTLGGTALIAQLTSEQTVHGVAYTNSTSDNTIKYTGTPTLGETYTLNATDAQSQAITITVIVTEDAPGSIMYSGNPRNVGDYSLPATGSDGTSVAVGVRVVDSGSGGAGEGNCYLLKFDSQGNKSWLTLDNVQKIEDTISATLSEISTIIYGFDRNVVVDLGTTEKFTVTFTRVQIIQSSYNDDDNWANQAGWSNGHWAKKVREFFADWQNLNRDNSYDLMGGYTFHYKPMIEVPDDANDLYPTIDRNVFLAGQVTFQYRGQYLQKLVVSIPLAVGRMRQNRTSSSYQINYIPNLSGAPALSAYYPLNVNSIAPECPPEWVSFAGANIFNTWRAGSVAYSPGSSVPSSVRSLSAEWQEASYVGAVDNGSTKEYTVQASDTKAVIYIIGGGGGGGAESFSTRIPYGNGGGGGSGGMIIKTVLSLTGVSKIYLSSAAATSTYSTDGNPSYASFISSGDVELARYTAYGGKKGGNAGEYGNPAGAGGAAGGNGGNAGSSGSLGSGIPVDDGDGGSGGMVSLSGAIQFALTEGGSFTLDPAIHGAGGRGYSQSGTTASDKQAKVGNKGAVVLMVYRTGST